MESVFANLESLQTQFLLDSRPTWRSLGTDVERQNGQCSNTWLHIWLSKLLSEVESSSVLCACARELLARPGKVDGVRSTLCISETWELAEHSEPLNFPPFPLENIRRELYWNLDAEEVQVPSHYQFCQNHENINFYFIFYSILFIIRYISTSFYINIISILFLNSLVLRPQSLTQIRMVFRLSPDVVRARRWGFKDDDIPQLGGDLFCLS